MINCQFVPKLQKRALLSAQKPAVFWLLHPSRDPCFRNFFSRVEEFGFKIWIKIHHKSRWFLTKPVWTWRTNVPLASKWLLKNYLTSLASDWGPGNENFRSLGNFQHIFDTKIFIKITSLNKKNDQNIQNLTINSKFGLGYLTFDSKIQNLTKKNKNLIRKYRTWLKK